MLTKTTYEISQEYEIPDCPEPFDCDVCEYSKTICEKKWYPADEVDKELSALSGTELAKENTRLKLELEEKKEDTKIFMIEKAQRGELR